MTEENDVSSVVPHSEQISLASGLALTLEEPSVVEYRDGMKLFDSTPDKWLPSKLDGGVELVDGLERYGKLLWLLCRRAHGRVTKAGPWVLTLEDLQEQFTMRDLLKHMETIARFFALGLAGGRTDLLSASSAPASATPTS